MIENDDVFDAMAGLRRREVLVGLLEGEPQPVTGLSAAARELTEANDAYLRAFLDGEMDIDGVEKAVVALHHLDLPLLAEMGFVEWSVGAREVRRGPRFEELRPLLELVAEADRTETEPEPEPEPEFLTTPR